MAQSCIATLNNVFTTTPTTANVSVPALHPQTKKFLKQTMGDFFVILHLTMSACACFECLYLSILIRDCTGQIVFFSLCKPYFECRCWNLPCYYNNCLQHILINIWDTESKRIFINYFCLDNTCYPSLFKIYLLFYKLTEYA